MTREVRGRSVDDRQSVVGNGKRSAMRDVHRRRLRILVSNDQQPRRCGRCRRCIASATAHAKCTPAAHRSESSAVPRRILGHVDHPISSVDCGLSRCVLAPSPQAVPKNIRARKHKTWDLRALATMRHLASHALGDIAASTSCTHLSSGCSLAQAASISAWVSDVAGLTLRPNAFCWANQLALQAARGVSFRTFDIALTGG